VPSEQPVTVDVTREERYWYPDDGGIVWVAGFHLVAADGSFLGREAPELADRGLVITSIAGAAQHHADVLQTDALEPGRPLALRRDAGNEHDANAIAVDTAAGEQAGWVWRELAADLAPRIDTGEPWSAVALRERRDSPRDPRTGVTILLARAPAIDLREVSARRRTP
jgi:HIRAN domain